MEELAETYRGHSDEQIALLYGQLDSLTETARCALLSEVQTRGLSIETISALGAELADHAASVDREFREQRKAGASRAFTGLLFGPLFGPLVAYLIRSFRSRRSRDR